MTSRVVLLYVALGVLRVVDCLVAMFLSFPLWLYPESRWPWRILCYFEAAIDDVRADIERARWASIDAEKWKPRVGACVVGSHTLKTWPEYFAEVEADRKPFELRRDDRNWVVGDDVVLAEWDPALGLYTGRTATRKITYILRGCDCKVGGLEVGYCILGIRRWT